MGSADDLTRLFDSVVGTVTLRASDLSRQTNFYENGIGLRVSEDGEEACELDGAPGHPLIRLDTKSAAGAEPAREPHTGLFHTAFRYPDRASLGAAVARVGSLAREYQGASDHGVSEAVYFADPEGNGIELYRDRPFEDWPAAEPGRVGMFTRPLDVRSLLTEASEEAGAVKPDIGHIHLMTADAERALTFWRDLVGLSERQRLGQDAVFLAEGPYHHHLAANSWRSAGAGPLPSDRPGLESFELRLRNQAAVEAAADALEASGRPVERGEGVVRFRDPDSNAVLLSSRR